MEYEAGTRFIEAVWYSFACKIVESMIELHKVNEKDANELRDKFLKRGDYSVECLG